MIMNMKEHRFMINVNTYLLKILCMSHCKTLISQISFKLVTKDKLKLN